MGTKSINRKKFKLKPSEKALGAMIYCVATVMIPNIVLDCTETYGIWSILAGILFPLGFYITFCSCIRRTGLQVLLMLIFMIYSAFQIVLLYLFGNSIIATDMFVNVLTTNPTEATELLSNIAPAVAIVTAIYLPQVIYAIYMLHMRYRITRRMRRISLGVGIPLMLVGATCLLPAKTHNKGESVFLNEVFPANVIYNMKLGIEVQQDVLNYEETSRNFKYGAYRTDNPRKREIYVYVIGEAVRASSCSLYGYERETTPRLDKRNDIYVFRNVLTQSNTTHKSVPMFLSSAWAGNHDAIYERKGIATLFKEAGFKTYFISNQSPQGAMVDKLGQEADEHLYIGAPRYDMQLLQMMRRIIESSDEKDILFILHCYGSHFSYGQRYPSEDAFFKPEGDVLISPSNVEILNNSYDNSIRYTDKFLDQTIEYLSSIDACTAMLYCSDHGEDMFDDNRSRFLHASPTVTYYQLHVPSIVWFSKPYLERYSYKATAARKNEMAPATTHSMFNTMADIASIRCDYVDEKVSLVSPSFDFSAPRYYLDDHSKAVRFNAKIGLTKADAVLFKKHSISSL